VTAPRVSVIIPCYNRSRYVPEAVRSVPAADAGVEIIVVDDGSTDDTARVLARCPMVRYLWQENRGPGAARNSGLAAATGVYIVFLDSDDRLLPGAIAAGIASLDAEPECAFTFGRYRTIAADGSVLSATSQHTRFETAQPFRSLLEGNHVGIMSNAMFRRSALLAVGGFDPARVFCADYDLYLRLSRRFPVARHAAVVADYRLHGGNRSHDAAAMLTTALDILEAQRALVSHSRSLRGGLRRGRRGWRDCYGERLLDSCRDAALNRRWSDAARAFTAMVRLCGLRTPAVIALHALPRSARTALREWRD
jgi:hypothetical protein